MKIGRPKVNLHIEELVLHGFPPTDSRSVGDALTRELGMLFGQQRIPESITKGAETDHIDAGAFHVAPNAKAKAIGQHAARAIYKGLTR
jgi:hypothetical protein